MKHLQKEEKYHSLVDFCNDYSLQCFDNQMISFMHVKIYNLEEHTINENDIDPMPSMLFSI